MRKLGILALAVTVVGGTLAYGQSLASDSHYVILEMGELYRLVVSRVGTPEKDVHMILDPFEREVSDDSTRLSYFLNRIGPNGTEITWACTWPRNVEWVKLVADADWSKGVSAPGGHALVWKHLEFCHSCPSMIYVLVRIDPDADIGWFSEYITIVYTASVLDPSVRAGTTETGTARFVMGHRP